MTLEPERVPQKRRGRGRPRDQAVGTRVREAARAELAGNGVAHFSISRVARRAGVAKGTVSLRWPEPLDLLIDALREQLGWDPVPDLGSLAAELRLIAQRTTAVLTPPGFELAMHLVVVSARHPNLRERYRRHIVEVGLDHTRQAFIRARTRGELRPDVDLDPLVQTFIGAIVVATMWSPDMAPPDQEQCDRIVAVTLAACRALGNDDRDATRCHRSTPTGSPGR
ncbi:TetR/AcrR family transcriptional regulator [Frankia sp. Cppng1_Ct_nod]|uniref:TetR/AcrR family transcriptional regulator n=1 Tax=Frankia sp. Cppng1_Ct_nod TaxID=2897162 RepID=UPI001040F949|nr:TetR/AcrR family transcriptional regulator [Frankia sp. Cppng1_Ct_nod]